MKRYILIILTVVFVFWSCNNPFQSNDEVSHIESDIPVLNGDLTISFSGFSRTIVPDVSMVTAEYEINGIGPDSETFNISSITETSHTQPGLVTGVWNITVTAKNSLGTILGEGSNTVDISDGNTSCTVIIKPIVGTGSVDLTINWPINSIDAAGITAEIGLSGQSLQSIDFIMSENSASYTVSDLSNGYYLLLFTFSDGEMVKYRHVESIRVLNGITTTGVIEITESDLKMDSAHVPEFSIASGTYEFEQTISITSNTTGANIRYTTNGSIPTSTIGFLYIEPFTIHSSQTIKAVTYAEGYNNSQIVSKEYIITGTVAVPTVSPYENTYYEAMSVTLSCVTNDTSIIYTMDGSVPVPGSNGDFYSTVIPVSETTTIKAIAFSNTDLNNKSELMISTYSITGIVADPVYTISGSTYNSEQSVGLSSTTSDSIIIYTTDGITPSSENGYIYTSPITINKNMTIKSIAIKENWKSSSVLSEEYIMTCINPVPSVVSGTYFDNQTVSLTTTTPAFSIYYTIDGTAPDETSILYESPITVNVSIDIKAITIRDDWNSSEVILRNYELKVSPPEFSIIPGNYTDSLITVDFTSITPDSQIVYTYDGNDPEPGVTGNFGSTRIISAETTLKLIGTKTGWSNSDIVTGLYNVGQAIDALLPTIDEVVTNSLPSFLWNINTVYGCHIQISDATDFSTTIVDDDTLLTDSYTSTVGLSEGINYWRVKQKDVNGTWSDWSSTFTFSVDLEEPVNGSPSSNEVITDTTPTLSWDEVTGATGYEVEVNTSSDFTGTVIETDNTITTNSYTLTTVLSDSTNYYWRVKQKDVNGAWSGWSSIWTLKYVLIIGDSYEGGIVFYLDGSGGGLIAALVDISGGTYGLTVSGADGTAIGTGAQNTLDIIAGDSSTTNAAHACADYSVDVDGVTYSDWFLPSKDELNQMYVNKAIIGGFTISSYWSSSEYHSSRAWGQYFLDGSQYGYYLENHNRYVRPVRAF